MILICLAIYSANGFIIPDDQDETSKLFLPDNELTPTMSSAGVGSVAEAIETDFMLFAAICAAGVMVVLAFALGAFCLGCGYLSCGFTINRYEAL